VAQLPSRKPFVFSLNQNFGPQLAAGKLFYQKRPDGIVERLSPIFFIGIGRKMLITGPYELLSDILYTPIIDADMPSIARLAETNLEYGIWQELRVTCPYHINFQPLVPIEQGIIWNEPFCKEFGLEIGSWRNLINVSLGLDQIETLIEELTRINE
jgi:hypothetical protein